MRGRGPPRHAPRSPLPGEDRCCRLRHGLSGHVACPASGRDQANEAMKGRSVACRCRNRPEVEEAVPWLVGGQRVGADAAAALAELWPPLRPLPPV